MANRTGFKFYRSYYDVYCELDKKDRLDFIDALFKKQFFNIEPSLSGNSKFAYISQRHSIDAQVKGFIDKMGEIDTPIVPPTLGAIVPPCQEVEEKGKEKEEVKVKEKENITTDFFTQENKELCWYIYSIWNLEKREVVDEVEKMRLWLIDKDRTTKNWKLFTINWMKRTPKRPKPLEMTAVVETLETHGPSMEELEGKTENFSTILKQF